MFTGHTEKTFSERPTTPRIRRPVIAAIFDIDFVIFTAPLDGSHEHPAKIASLEAMRLMVSDM